MNGLMKKNATELLSVCLFALVLSTAQAAVVVTNSEITGGTSYSFNLTGNDLNLANPSPLKGAYEAATSYNMSYASDEWARWIGCDVGQTNAILNMCWDFSQSDYRPTSVNLYNNLFIANGPSTMQLRWSTNGTSWTNFESLTWPGSGVVTYSGTDTITLGSPNKFYMQVAGIATTPPDGNVFKDQGDQWARVGIDSPDTAFSAAFTMAAVPEPATAVMLALSLAVFPLLRPSKRRD